MLKPFYYLGLISNRYDDLERSKTICRVYVSLDILTSQNSDHVHQKIKFQPFWAKKYIFFQLFKVKKDMLFQPVVQKLNCFPALLKVDLSRNLEYSYIIRVRIVGNVGNKIIPLHISKAYLKAVAKALGYIQATARV